MGTQTIQAPSSSYRAQLQQQSVRVVYNNPNELPTWELSELRRGDETDRARTVTRPRHEGLNALSIEEPVALPPSKVREHVQFFALCWSLVLRGWQDGTTGPLLPRLQTVYHIGFTTASTVFIASCVGSIACALSNVWLTQKIGFGKIMVLGATCELLACCMQITAPPFPVFVLGYFFTGLGGTFQDVQGNTFVISYKDKHAATKMGILHAMYGTGATLGPLAATQFAQLRRWNFFYLTTIGLCLANVVMLVCVFRFKRQEECLAQIGQAPTETDTSSDSHYRQILRLKAVYLLACFLLVYVGLEVTIGGWIVTYINDVRGGGPSSGYISSGFFGGLTVGRVVLLWINRKVGERRALFVYAVSVICLELVVWFVPSLIGGAVAISLVGVLLGPVYPLTMSHAGRILPRWLLTGAIGLITGCGQIGSALLPFATGAIASKVGIRSLQPFLVSMMGLMVVFWALVPSGPGRMD